MEGINLEVRLFLASVVWGVVLVVLYDCLRIFRRVLIHNRFWAGLEDVIYWVISAVLIFRMLYDMNDGAIRGFAIAGVVLGMVLYFYSISEFLVKMISMGICKCIDAGKKTVHFIMKPIIWISRRFRWSFEYLAKITAKPCRAGRKSLKKILKQVKIAVVKK